MKVLDDICLRRSNKVDVLHKPVNSAHRARLYTNARVAILNLSVEIGRAMQRVLHQIMFLI